MKLMCLVDFYAVQPTVWSLRNPSLLHSYFLKLNIKFAGENRSCRRKYQLTYKQIKQKLSKVTDHFLAIYIFQ